MQIASQIVQILLFSVILVINWQQMSLLIVLNFSLVLFLILNMSLSFLQVVFFSLIIIFRLPKYKRLIIHVLV